MVIRIKRFNIFFPVKYTNASKVTEECTVVKQVVNKGLYKIKVLVLPFFGTELLKLRPTYSSRPSYRFTIAYCCLQ